MTKKLRMVLAQRNFLVGDIEGNTQKVIDDAKTAKEKLQADIIIFPELTLTGYPPEDLLLRPGLYKRIDKALLSIKQNHPKEIDILIGIPEQTEKGRFNKAVLIRDGEIIASYNKQYLPNYSVFDEVRYFKEGSEPCVVNIKGVPVALTICEDLWFPEPTAQACQAGAKIIITTNASPFDTEKPGVRENLMSKRAKEGKVPVVYVNLVGAQDELVFDGGSFVVDAQGKVCVQANYFEDTLMPIDIEYDESVTVIPQPLPKPMSEEERIYKAIVLGVKDYMHKNHFPGALVGLSGGIDSALTL